MIRTKTKDNYLRIIEVYEYYIKRESVDPKKVEMLMDNPEAIEVFGTYSSLRRSINKLKKKIPVGKKFFDKQKRMLEIYEKIANK